MAAVSRSTIDTIMTKLKVCGKEEKVPFGKMKKMISWLTDQVDYLQSRENWEVRGVMGGLKRWFGGRLPYCDEVDEIADLLREISGEEKVDRNAVGDGRRAAGGGGRRAAGGGARRAAGGGGRQAAGGGGRREEKSVAPTQFVVMMVPAEMVSAVLKKGGSIHQQGPLTTLPRQNTMKPRVDTRKMSIKELHAHSSSLKTATTIYLPNPTSPAETEELSIVRQALLGQGVRTSNSPKCFRYAVANKHRNGKVEVDGSGLVMSGSIVTALIEQGVTVTGGIVGQLGEGQEMCHGGMTPAGMTPTGMTPTGGATPMAGAITPRSPDESDDEEDDDEEDDDEAVLSIDFGGGVTFRVGQEVSYQGKVWEITDVGTGGVTLDNDGTLVTLKGAALSDVTVV